MKYILQVLRYMLIIVAILATIYLVELPSYANYTFLTLLYIAIERFHHRWMETSYEIPFKIGQIVYIYYLNHLYHGFLFVLFFASLFSFQADKRKPFHLVLLVLQLVMMNAIVIQRDVSIVILANIIYVIIVATLFLMQNISRQKEEIQFLYDSLRQHHYELDEARKRLVEYTARVEDVVQMEERNRISKEIHDEIGHKLIRIKMLMEALIRVVPTDTQKAMEMMYLIRDQLAESMETLRTTVRKLKPKDEQVRSFSIRQLAEDFTKGSGIEVQLETNGTPHMLFPSIEVSLYRNAQEALTNAVRHGRATRITITLDYFEDAIEMTIKNNGVLPKDRIQRGLGLRGMEERVELLGGKIETEITDVFAVKTIIPYRKGRENWSEALQGGEEA